MNHHNGLTCGVYAGGKLVAAFMNDVAAQSFIDAWPKMQEPKIKPLPDDWNYQLAAGYDSAIQEAVDRISKLTFDGKLLVMTTLEDIKNEIRKMPRFPPDEPVAKPETLGGMPILVSEEIPDGCVILVDRERHITVLNLGGANVPA